MLSGKRTEGYGFITRSKILVPLINLHETRKKFVNFIVQKVEINQAMIKL